jgi:hypothetical protein
LFKASADDENIAVQRGYNMAFGSLSYDLLLELNVELLDTLLRNCVAKGIEFDDAETRRQAIKSLVSVVKSLTIEKIDVAQFIDVIEVLYKAVNDYAVDRRGDVGSWVRCAAMEA